MPEQLADQLKEKPKYRVLIALDPTEPELQPNEASLSWFRKWVGERKASVEAVFVSFGHSGSHAIVVQEGVLNTPAAIQKFALDEKVDLIGMASVSRGLQSAVLGSVAKEIFRFRKWPVWVCGPETIYERKKTNLLS